MLLDLPNTKYISSPHPSPKMTRSWMQCTNSDALLDALAALYQGCSALKNDRSGSVTRFLSTYESIYTDVNKSRVNKNDFEIVKSLAKGQHGKVFVVRCKKNQQIYAMKVMNKQHVLKTHETTFLMEEQLVLSHPNAGEWIPSLYASFQDEDNLYLVMEYAGGGDLFSILDRKVNLRLSEDEARFYIAETILAVDRLHSLGYVHRDIKPQNILIDANGHVKIADFGSCIRIESCSKIPPHRAVGTCDYVSPEVLQAPEGRITYGTEVDWWSIGIVLYEMLQEFPPFYSEQSEIETYRKILCHESSLSFNEDIPLSDDAKDLISRLLAPQAIRLGKGGLHEIMSHPFFKGVDWDNIRNQQPPFQPKLSSPDDTSNFSVHDDEAPLDSMISASRESDPIYPQFDTHHLPFIGYTFSGKPLPLPSTSNSELETRLAQMKADNEALKKQVEILTAQLENPPSRLEDELRMVELEVSLQQETSTRHQYESERDAIKETLDNEQKAHQELQVKYDELQSMVGPTDTDKEEWYQKVQALEKEVTKERTARQDAEERARHAHATSTRLRAELDRALKRNDMLPPSPTRSISQQPSVPSSPVSLSPSDLHEMTTNGRSAILDTMWRRDRDALRSTQLTLDSVQNDLSQARREVSRLRKRLGMAASQPFQMTTECTSLYKTPKHAQSYDELPVHISQTFPPLHSSTFSVPPPTAINNRKIAMAGGHSCL